jgi:hypothetical protein
VVEQPGCAVGGAGRTVKAWMTTGTPSAAMALAMAVRRRGRSVIFHFHLFFCRDSPYKRECGRENARRPSSKPAGDLVLVRVHSAGGHAAEDVRGAAARLHRTGGSAHRARAGGLGWLRGSWGGDFWGCFLCAVYTAWT